MAIRFQYNKISLQSLNKQLKVRTQALPILKNKESALRIEVKKARDKAQKFNEELSEILGRYNQGIRLWSEFDAGLLHVRELNVRYIKIAGIKIPEYENITFDLKPFSLFDTLRCKVRNSRYTIVSIYIFSLALFVFS